MTPTRAVAGRKCVAVLAVVLMVAIPSIPADGEETVDPTRLQWWDTTTIGDGFHIRVPVTVHNPHDHPIENGLVLAELDLAQKLTQAGWVSQPRSGADLLRSFELDEASIRVVTMTDLDPMVSGTTQGLLGRYPLTDVQSPDDPRRSEVPSVHFPGFLSGEGDTFDARSDPRITVMWNQPGTLQPGEEGHYVVYLDSRTNRIDPHQAPEYRERPGGAMLERAFWSGPGTDLFGHVVPGSQSGKVTVIGLHDDTEVEVLLGDIGSGSFQKQPDQFSHSNPFTIGRHGFRDLHISLSEPVPVRLLADKPILALVDSEGFVPATSGTVVGDEFLFATTHRPEDAQDSLYLYNHNPHPASDNIKPTVVQLEQLVDDEWTVVQDVHFSDSTNLLPYTVGSRSDRSSGGCSFPTDSSMAVIEPGEGRYRATVTSGGPVALQLQPVRGVTQVPAVDGAPWGTEFWTALNRVSDQESTCGDLRQFGVYASSMATTTLGLSNPESSATLISPPCNAQRMEDCEEWHEVGSLPDDALTGVTFKTEGLPERPFRFDTGSSSSLMIGPPPLPDSIIDAPLRGPLGGADSGRLFVGYGSAGGPPLVYAPFASSTVNADIHYAASGTEEVSIPLVGQRIDSLPERAGDPILSYGLESDRPTVVVPRGASTGFLAGTPPTLAATVHGADFRGHLVEIKSTSGLDPVSTSTTPGESVTYDFIVTNLGRDVGGGDLEDAIDLAHTTAPDGWQVQLSRNNIRLDSGESGSVRLTVTPLEGEDAPEPGDLVAISVVATSTGSKGKVFHSADTVTHIKRSYDVEIWFDKDGVLSKTDERHVGVDEAANFTVLVRNAGTTQDTVNLDLSHPEPGWQTQLLDGDQSVQVVDLAPKETARLTFHTVPPPGATQSSMFTTIRASSASSPAASDSVFAQTTVRTPSDLSLDLDQFVQWVEPGKEAVFGFALRNSEDAGATEVTLDVRADELPGWTDPRVFIRQFGGDGRVFQDRVSIESGQTIHFGVMIDAPADALTGDRVSMRLNVNIGNNEGNLGEFLHAIVRPVHHIETNVTSSLPLAVTQGGTTVPVDIRLTNNGNMDERLVPAVASLPPGWNFTFPAQEVFLPRGSTQELSIGVTVPKGTAEGEYTTRMELVSEDGNRTSVEIPVRVGAFTSHALFDAERVEGQPGRIAWVEHTVHNDGNTPLSVRMESDNAEAWPLQGTDSTFLVPVGANVTFRLGWQVPREAPDGVSEHRATIVLDPESPGAESRRDTLQVAIDVGRPALRVVHADGFQGPAGQVVRTAVTNEGTRTAEEMHVELRVDGIAVDRVAVARLPVGGSSNITLLQPVAHQGQASVVVDPDSMIVESDRSDNVLLVTPPDGRETPTVGIGVVLLVLLAGMAAGRRRGGRP